MVRSRTFEFYIIQGQCRPVFVTWRESHSLEITDRSRSEALQGRSPQGYAGTLALIAEGKSSQLICYAQAVSSQSSIH